MTHKELVKIAERWLLTAKGCAFSFAEFEFGTANGEWPDAFGFRSTLDTVLVECKATRADFLSDKKKRFRRNPHMGMGKYRFYMCPKGLIQPDELPKGWGLVWVNDNGKAIQKVGPKGTNWDRQPEFHNERCQISEMTMMYSALRRFQVNGVFHKVYEVPERE